MAWLQHLRRRLVYIAAVKPHRFLLAITGFALSLQAADVQTLTVKGLSVENTTVLVTADLQGKLTQLECQIRPPSCSQPQPGEYSMRPVTADEGIYEDCTNVVLLKSSGAAKEKIGVYCWLNAKDEYLVSSHEARVETTPAAVDSSLVARSSETSDTWHWFESCGGTRNLELVVLLDGKAVYRSRFAVCRNSGPTLTAEHRKIVFHFKGGRVFQGKYRTLATQTIEANIWQAGADSDALLLGVTFVSDRVLLNSIHVAKPDSTSESQLDRGVVVRTFPLTRK